MAGRWEANTASLIINSGMFPCWLLKLWLSYIPVQCSGVQLVLSFPTGRGGRGRRGGRGGRRPTMEEQFTMMQENNCLPSDFTKPKENSECSDKTGPFQKLQCFAERWDRHRSQIGGGDWGDLEHMLRSSLLKPNKLREELETCTNTSVRHSGKRQARVHPEIFLVLRCIVFDN